MQEQITTLVEFVFDMDARLTAAAQQEQLRSRLVDFLSEDSEAVEFTVKRFEPEFDTYSNLTRDRTGRAIRVGDKVFWRRHICPVTKINEKRITIDTGAHRKSSIDPLHCVVVI